VSDTDWPTSPLAAAEAAFAALTRDPDPLTLDLDMFDPALGLPRGPLSLSAVRDWLLRHPDAYPARDAVWRELIRRARSQGPQWMIAAVGAAMPALRRYAGQLCARYLGDAEDIDAEVLTGFLTALRDRVDLAKPAPYAGLCMAAWRAGWQLRLQQAQTQPVADIEHLPAESRTPRMPYGHPDLLVRRAVMLGILDPVDEQPYIDVRLDRRPAEVVAAVVGISVDALRMRLRRVDARLAESLAAGVLTGVSSPQAGKAIAEQAHHRGKTRAGRATAVAA
jgi:DNA-directed RNA polymerase specialized sigma24 family protein